MELYQISPNTGIKAASIQPERRVEFMLAVKTELVIKGIADQNIKIQRIAGTAFIIGFPEQVVGLLIGDRQMVLLNGRIKIGQKLLDGHGLECLINTDHIVVDIICPDPICPDIGANVTAAGEQVDHCIDPFWEKFSKLGQQLIFSTNII